MQVFFEGFLLQASLILALGAQNLFVLNSGLKRERHLFVALVCSLCDAVLVLLGVLGMSALFAAVPIFKIVIGALGVEFLFYYGVLKLREAFDGNAPTENTESSPRTLRQTLLTTLAFSLLNPHVFLDTLVLIGGYSAKFPLTSDRLTFGLGASVASAVWFFGLALLSSALSRLLRSARTMQLVSFISGAVLIALSFVLGRDVWSWLT